MREVEKLAQEKFNGDIYKALDYAYRNWGSTVNDRMSKLYSELTKEELKMAAQIIRNLAIERSGKDKVEKFEKSIGIMKSLNLSDDEITKAKENPFKKSMIISIISMLIVIVVPLLLHLAVDNATQKWIESAQVILIGIFASKLADSVRKSFLFKKAKQGLCDTE